MFILNFGIIFLFKIIGQSLLNAASITINNVNISWQYDKQATNFSINSTLAAGINPGLNF
jgi:hypothetical protein